MGLSSTKKSENNSLDFKIMEFKDNFVVLQNSSGEIIWPKEKIPSHSQIGDTIHLSASNCTNEDRYKIMRRLLEELIN